MKSGFIFIICQISFITLIIAQGFENFSNFPSVAGTYTNGSFIGNDSSVWTYQQCRGDKAIELPTPCLGKKRTPTASLISGTLHHGCGSLVFSYRQAFSSAVNLNLFVNGSLVKNVVSAGGMADTGKVYSSDSIRIYIQGDFVLEFRQADSLLSGQVSIDNVFWTSWEGGVGLTDDKTQPKLRLILRNKVLDVISELTSDMEIRLFSMSGVLVAEKSIAPPQTSLYLGFCQDGNYLAVIFDRDKKIIMSRKLLLR